LKNRIHATLMTFAVPAVQTDLFGPGGRAHLARVGVPEPWASDVTAALAVIDHLDEQIAECERRLKVSGAEHPYLPLLMSAPGIGWVLGYTIAAEIGDITRFPSPRQLVGYTGLCPRVYQSADKDRRGSLTKAGPRTCADRGRGARRQPPGLPAAPSAHRDPARQSARQESRPGGDRPSAHRGDLAHAEHRQALCSGRRPQRSGRLTAPA
jgi:transposase